MYGGRLTLLCLLLSVIYAKTSPVPKPDTGYDAPRQYHRPSRPSYKPSYKPVYREPEYPRRPPPTRTRPYRYANYDYDYGGEDPYLHIHKEEAARSALLFGVGLLKGVAVTALVNSANNGITIGK